MLKMGQVKEIYELKGAVCSIRVIADGLGIALNTVHRYPCLRRGRFRTRRRPSGRRDLLPAGWRPSTTFAIIPFASTVRRR